MRRASLVFGVLVATALPAQAEEFTVQVQSNFFAPAQLTISPGDSVRWVKSGGGEHNVNMPGRFRCAEGCDGEGGNGDPSGAQWEFTKTFDQVGSFGYQCDNHVQLFNMRGTITVEEQEEPPPEEPEAIAPNFGHTGSWYNPATDGQGFNIEVVVRDGEPASVVVYWFTFADPAAMAAGKDHAVDGQRWFIATGELPAPDNVVPLEVFISSGGAFDAAEPVPEQESSGTGTLQFSSCTEGTLSYEVALHNADAQMVSGEIPIQRLTPDVECQNLAGQ